MATAWVIAFCIGYLRTNCAIDALFHVVVIAVLLLVPLLKTNECCVYGICHRCTAQRRLFTFNGKVYKRKKDGKIAPTTFNWLKIPRSAVIHPISLYCVAVDPHIMWIYRIGDCAYVKFSSSFFGVFAPCFIMVHSFLSFCFSTIIFSLMAFLECFQYRCSSNRKTPTHLAANLLNKQQVSNTCKQALESLCLMVIILPHKSSAYEHTQTPFDKDKTIYTCSNLYWIFHSKQQT